MILHFPCLKRNDSDDIRAGRIDNKWYQSRLSEYNQGVSFSDMVDYRLDQYTRAVLAENADHPVDLTYPNEQWAETMIDDPECIQECNRVMEMIKA